jgi:hypothetical protein
MYFITSFLEAASRLLKNTHLIRGSRGGAFDATTMCLYAYGTTRCLTTQTADRQLCRGFDKGCFHAGLSDEVRETLPFYRFSMILLWLKSPFPLSL